VKPPGYDHRAEGEEQAATDQIEMDLPRYTYNAYNTSQDRYEWNPIAEFTKSGTYQVFFFARDDLSANVSSLVETTVYKAKAGNSPPDEFSLIAPQDGATDLTTVILNWEDAFDPDGDHLTYTVLISKDGAAFSNPIRKSGLMYSACLVGPQDGLQDLSTYYWKVLAIDEYGAVTESDARIFHTNNTNPVFGWINGRVYDSESGTPISSAQVAIGKTVIKTVAGGYYLSTLMPGSYTLTVTAAGYRAMDYANIVLPEGEIITRDVGLTATDSDVAAFVTRFYRLCLGRDPDPAGLDGWEKGLLDGTLTGADVAYGFVFSPEFIEKDTTDEEYLQVLYEAFFDRQPDPVGWQGWIEAMRNGATREDVLNGFIFAKEFEELCDRYDIKAHPNHYRRTLREAVVAFVARFYQFCLDRAADPAGLEGWAIDLLSKNRTGSDVAEGFIYSPEFIEKNPTNEEYLTILYKAFFDREPDPAGWDVWLAELNSGKDRGEVLNGFLGSQEFIQLCEGYGITPFR
jgi:hypothetical protein